MIDDVFAVIADPTRRQLLRVLSSGRHSVGELVEELDISQPTVSKHLKVLREAGLAETEAEGQRRYYSLTPAPLQKVSLWIDALNTAYRQEGPGSGEDQTGEGEANTALPAETPAQQLDRTEPIQPAHAATATEADLQPKDAEPAEKAESAEKAQATAETAGAAGQEAAESDPSEPSRVAGTATAQQQAVTFTPLTPFTPSVFEPEKAPGAESPEEEATDGTGYPEEIPPALPTAYAQETDTESRGLLATLSRWGRRRR